jgi:hypothetical protein
MVRVALDLELFGHQDMLDFYRIKKRWVKLLYLLEFVTGLVVNDGVRIYVLGGNVDNKE